VSRPGGRRDLTPLQASLTSAYSILDDAREELSETEYVAFIYVLLDRIRFESARLAFGEALRARRDGT